MVGSTTQLAQGSAVLLLNPSDTTHGFFTSRNVRCRANPSTSQQLRGSYQQSSIVTTTVTKTVGAASPVTTVTPVTTLNRNFLTFFEDGTFLYGVHATGGNCTSSCGVAHGFYAYNNVAGTITFTPLVDTVTASNANRLSPGGAAATLTSVVKTPGPQAQITARFTSASPATTTTVEAGVTIVTTTSSITDWLLAPPESIDGQMTGAWVTADHRRMWIYDGSSYAGFHAGVNGLGNVQDACFAIEDPLALSGTYTRRGNSSTCQLNGSGSNIFTLDIPNASTVPRLPEGYVGKWPQSGSNADGRPSSPVLYTLNPGLTDRLTIQNTQHGTPVDPHHHPFPNDTQLNSSHEHQAPLSRQAFRPASLYCANPPVHNQGMDPEEIRGPGGANAGARAEEVERLFRDHNESLIRFLTLRLQSRQEAREVAQEAYVRLLQLRTPDVASFVRAYLFRIAGNLAIDRLRRRATESKFQDQELFSGVFDRPAGAGTTGDRPRTHGAGARLPA